ncbi:MAG: TadE family type IV pilus minor pilin, partial [Nocardioides sp.]
AQLRVIDAARETARAIARGDDQAAAVAAGRHVTPAGGRVAVIADGDDGSTVRVEASARIAGPGPLLGWLPGVRVHAVAVAMAEEDP